MSAPTQQSSDDDDDIKSWVDETLKMRGITEIPTRLYKFVSPDSKYFPLAMHELFLHSRIYLSSRQDFNDPFDSRFALDVPNSPEEIVEYVNGFAKRNPDLDIETLSRERIDDPQGWHQRAQASMESSMDNIGIYSMADSVRHPLMWAHYAGAHRGIALVLNHGTENTFGAFPIRYQKEFPRSKIGPTGIDIYAAFVKGEWWRYEGEWRKAESRGGRQWTDVPRNILHGVVFGALVSQETFEFVMDLIKRRVDAGLPGLHVYRAEIGPSFDLKFYKLGTEDWHPVELR